MTTTPEEGASEDPTMPTSHTTSRRLRGTWRRMLARVYFGQAAAGASDYARALVPTIGESHARPGEYVQEARRLQVWVLEVMTAAVLVERANGASWAQVAAAFGYDEDFVRGRWAPVEQAWLDGENVQLGDELVIDSFIDAPTSHAEATKAAELLDMWVRRENPSHARPFTDGLPDRQ